MSSSLAWPDVLSNHRPGHHIVLLYQDQDFLVGAAARFITTALERGDGVVLAADPLHWRLVSRALHQDGINPQMAQDRGQVLFLDARAAIDAFMVQGRPDRRRFDSFFAPSLKSSLRNSSTRQVSFWNEMSHQLWANGDVLGALLSDEFVGGLAAGQPLATLCSYHMDNFDRQVTREPLPGLCRLHTHLIPASDYARLDAAVLGAVEDILGKGEASILKALLATHAMDLPEMPVGQAMIFWLRTNLPATADAVLLKARHAYLHR